MLAQELDVELLETDGSGVGEVFAVGEVGFAVVFGGFFEEALGEGCFELLEREFPVVPFLALFGGEVFEYFVGDVLGECAFGAHSRPQGWCKSFAFHW